MYITCTKVIAIKQKGSILAYTAQITRFSSLLYWLLGIPRYAAMRESLYIIEGSGEGGIWSNHCIRLWTNWNPATSRSWFYPLIFKGIQYIAGAIKCVLDKFLPFFCGNLISQGPRVWLTLSLSISVYIYIIYKNRLVLDFWTTEPSLIRYHSGELVAVQKPHTKGIDR